MNDSEINITKFQSNDFAGKKFIQQISILFILSYDMDYLIHKAKSTPGLGKTTVGLLSKPVQAKIPQLDKWTRDINGLFTFDNAHFGLQLASVGYNLKLCLIISELFDTDGNPLDPDLKRYITGDFVRYLTDFRKSFEIYKQKSLEHGYL